jgi:DNA-binding XRE family transcriptional regulator
MNVGREGEALETNQAVSGLSFYDMTRWRRSLPLGASPLTLGERLRAHRLEFGISQEAAAKVLGVGRVTVYRWECGRDVPPPLLRPSIQRFLRRPPRRGPS